MSELIEILGAIGGAEDGAPRRLIGRDGAGRYALGEERHQRTPDGREVILFARTTPLVSFDDVARCADSVLAGDERAMTWPHALKVLALGYAALRAELEFDNSRLASADSPSTTPEVAGHQAVRSAAAERHPGALPRPDQSATAMPPTSAGADRDEEATSAVAEEAPADISEVHALWVKAGRPDVSQWMGVMVADLRKCDPAPPYQHSLSGALERTL